jgi:hypothetical protein
MKIHQNGHQNVIAGVGIFFKNPKHTNFSGISRQSWRGQL